MSLQAVATDLGTAQSTVYILEQIRPSVTSLSHQVWVLLVQILDILKKFTYRVVVVLHGQTAEGDGVHG